MLQIGTTVEGRYQILDIIGRGGTSCVYLALNIRIHKKIAIKEVYKNGSGFSGVVQNGLIAESTILTKLKHPNLPVITDVFENSFAFYIVMEYIEGKSLNKILERNGAQTEENIIKWACQLCDALHYLHSLQPPIIYRDMKPANIMLKPDGNVTLIDFGTAREHKRVKNSDTIHMGTRGYAAPEQYSSSGQTDARTDVYCLGVTLYHLITGCDPSQFPYGLRPIREMNPALSVKMEDIIIKCTQLNPDERYQTVMDLKRDLIGSQSTLERTSFQSMLWVVVLIPVMVMVMGITLAIVLTQEKEKVGVFASRNDNETTSMDRFDSFPFQAANNVIISEEREHVIFHFIPTQSGIYRFYSVSGDEIPMVWLSDAENETLTKANTDFNGYQEEFDFSYRLNADERYYLEFALFSYQDKYPKTGYFQVYVEYSGNR